jgi:uncharacterized surface protein with fasciclin (FAS1) repeats
MSSRSWKLNPFAAAAVATAVLIGAGAGALATISTPDPQPTAEIMNPMIDGQAMLPTADIADNIAVSPEHSVLAVYLKESGLRATLESKGPYTLFAPSDKAFMGAGNLGSQQDLTRLIDYHIVPGRLDSKTLLALIGTGGGRARLKTLDGGYLVASLNGPTNIVLMDENGATANISIYDIYDKNGVIQVLDHVMKPAGFGKKPVLTSERESSTAD